MRPIAIMGALLSLLSQGFAEARAPTPEDFLKLATIGSPQISPSGNLVVYTVRTNDLDGDKRETHVWLANADGSGTRQLTSRKGESETNPRFSPDGRLIGFLSARGESEDEEARLWILPLDGGEARPIEGVEGSVEDFAWAPDNRRLALIVMPPAPKAEKDEDGNEKPRPVVIDRYRFKDDGTGYLDDRRPHLVLYDLDSGEKRRLTDGNFAEELPAFSPDGRHVAFVSTRGDDPDRTLNSDLYLADIAAPGAEPRRLTAYEGSDGAPGSRSYPAWSPDGRTIAYLRGADPAKIWYGVTDLALVDVASGGERVLTAGLDRNVADPLWADSRTIRFLVEDDGVQYLASVPARGGPVSTVLREQRVLHSLSIARDGRMALLAGGALAPDAVHVIDGKSLRKVTAHNDALLAALDLGTVEYASATSVDGTEVRGFIFYPPGYEQGRRWPTVLNLHGGPTAQFGRDWDQEVLFQLTAGYVVLAPNPRGSTGRGEDYALGIDKAWGSVDVPDVLAMVDLAVARGISDPEKLAVSGWSYGGMLTNYVIASDRRFKAAVSGASISNVFAGYGTDHYILYYELEMGAPWENPEGWMRVSYPFFENQRILTPTLFIVGEKDVNVPTLASEQMYQALKSRGVDTRLVIYPGEHHEFRRPSFALDRMKRWVAWLDRYLK